MSPGAEWTDAVPPNPSMTALTIASPRPVEWAAECARESSARANRSNTWGRISGGMPAPSSATSTVAVALVVAEVVGEFGSDAS